MVFLAPGLTNTCLRTVLFNPFSRFFSYLAFWVLWSVNHWMFSAPATHCTHLGGFNTTGACVLSHKKNVSCGWSFPNFPSGCKVQPGASTWSDESHKTVLWSLLANLIFIILAWLPSLKNTDSQISQEHSPVTMTQKSRRAWQKRSVCTHDSSFSSTAFKGHPDGSVGKRNRLQCRRRWFYSWVKKICWRRDRLPTLYSWASLVAQMVKNLPVIREPWVRSLGWEDPLEKGKATHSSILAWRIPWTV